MTMLFRIAERALNRPLLIHPDKVPLILGVLEGRIPLGDIGGMRAEAEANIDSLPAEARAIMRGPAPQGSRFFGDVVDVDPATGATKGLPYRRTKEGVAIVSVVGTLVNRGAWIGSNSGEVSYEGIKFQLATALADPRATSILLDIESPGGEAVGAFEVASAVRAANAQKPVVAVANGMAASAAYAIASGAGRIVATPSAVVGSIGVVLLHVDYSRYLDKQGVTPTFVFAGAHKVDGNPYEPLPDTVREDMQREINQFYDLFVETVAAGRRGVSPAAIRETEARVFIGSEAVERGLADAVGTFEDVLADLSTRGASRSPPSRPKGASMDTNTPAAAPVAAVPASPAPAAAPPVDAAAIAQAERERVLGIQNAAFAGQEAMAADFIARGTSVGEAAIAFNAALKAKGPDHVAALRAMDAQVRVPANPSAGAGGDKPKAVPQTADGWKAEFAGSAELQAEFGSEADYVAFKTGTAKGAVRILSKPGH